MLSWQITYFQHFWSVSKRPAYWRRVRGRMCTKSYVYRQNSFFALFRGPEFDVFFCYFNVFLAESGGERAKTRVRTLVFAKSLKYVEDLCLFPSGALREIRWKSSPFSCFRHFAPSRFLRWRSHRGLVSTRTCRVVIGLFTAVPACFSGEAFFYVFWAFAGTRKRQESSTFLTFFSYCLYALDDFT